MYKIVADTVDNDEDIKKIASTVIDHMSKVTSPLVAEAIDYGELNRYVWDVLKERHDTDRAVVCYAIDESGKKMGIAGVVFYAIGTEWYSNKPMLYDRLVINIDNNIVGFGRIAVNILKKLMKANKCICLFDSTILADNQAMIRHGFDKHFKNKEMMITYIIGDDE